MVSPVANNLAVAGQRTSSRRSVLGIFRGVAGAKCKCVILESVTIRALSTCIERRLEFYPVACGEADEALAHPPGNVSQHDVLARKLEPKHGSGEVDYRREPAN